MQVFTNNLLYIEGQNCFGMGTDPDLKAIVSELLSILYLLCLPVLEIFCLCPPMTMKIHFKTEEQMLKHIMS